MDSISSGLMDSSVPPITLSMITSGVAPADIEVVPRSWMLRLPLGSPPSPRMMFSPAMRPLMRSYGLELLPWLKSSLLRLDTEPVTSLRVVEP